MYTNIVKFYCIWRLVSAFSYLYTLLSSSSESEYSSELPSVPSGDGLFEKPVKPERKDDEDLTKISSLWTKSRIRIRLRLEFSSSQFEQNKLIDKVRISKNVIGDTVIPI